MKNECLIIISQKRMRISIDFILQDKKECFTRKNNWTFDILSKELFKAIFRQMMDYEYIEKCYMLLPDKNEISEERLIQIDKKIIRELQIEKNVKVEFLKSNNSIISDTK